MQPTILIVEDNVDLRNSICSVLEFENWQILLATNGREALDILEQHAHQVDLILTDLAMPELSGLDLCREVRRQNQKAKIVIMTGYLSPETRAELQSMGVTHILKKPVEVQELLDAISCD
nr:response regulator [Nitrosomonas nitrosa]